LDCCEEREFVRDLGKGGISVWLLAGVSFRGRDRRQYSCGR